MKPGLLALSFSFFFFFSELFLAHGIFLTDESYFSICLQKKKVYFIFKFQSALGNYIPDIDRVEDPFCRC